ncbi:MAG: DeoR/GlpR family DNA-binding transcription regulator [Bosea sp. (in: a-proteobacteria)]
MSDAPNEAPPLNERQSRIVERVEQQGFVTIDALARDFSVSAQTVRREIILLDELGVLQRFHGGAGRNGSGERLSYEAKQTRELDAKQRIGTAMAAIVTEGQSIFLDVGTTAEATARALLQHKALTVVTPSATNARLLSTNVGIEVILTGGRILGADLSMAGPIALRTASAYRFDWAIIACSGIEAEGAVLDFDADKVALKQCAMSVAGRSALIADSAKFERKARLELCRIGAFDVLVTNEAPPKELAALLENGRVVLA